MPIKFCPEEIKEFQSAASEIILPGIHEKLLSGFGQELDRVLQSKYPNSDHHDRWTWIHDAILFAAMKLTDFENERKIFAYLIRTAINLNSDWWRKRKRILEREIPMDSLPSTMSVDIFLEMYNYLELLNAIQNLSESDSFLQDECGGEAVDAVISEFPNQITGEKLAERIDKPVRTANRLKNKIFLRLRELLRANGYNR